MICLGQSVVWRQYSSSDAQPAIVCGINKTGSYIVKTRSRHGNTTEKDFVFTTEILFLREKDETSPSGHRLYTGPYYRQNIAEPVKIKLPDNLDEEFDKIQELIKQQ